MVEYLNSVPYGIIGDEKGTELKKTRTETHRNTRYLRDLDTILDRNLIFVFLYIKWFTC